MFNRYGFLAVLALFTAGQCFAKPSVDEEYDDWSYDVGRPSSVTTERAKCKKDLLLIVDTSYSIGKHSFNENVKPFLQRLVTDLVLNVGRHGTQLALVIFSQEARTKVLLNFGDVYDAGQLSTFINNLKWSDVSGDRTRTDLALQIANEKIFPANNPQNNRRDVDDVVVLITDGAPHGKSNTKEKAIEYAQELKDKGVLIVAAAVGPQRNRFKHVLQQLATSKEYVLEANFEDMDEILGRLVASSCIKTGQCMCAEMKAATIDVQPGRSTATIAWPIPQFSCVLGRKPVITSSSVEPPVTSPHKFSVGKHTINYRFELKGGTEVVCPVSFKVKGELCRGNVFNSKAQACCCGAIHTKKPGHDCCGPVYYETYSQKCCPNANLASREDTCQGE